MRRNILGRVKIFLIDLAAITSSVIISYILKNPLNMRSSDILTIIGLITIVIGALGFINGMSNIIGIGAAGSLSNEYSTRFAAEAAKTEREITDYPKDFKKQNVFSYNSTSMNIIICGIIMILLSILAIKLGILF